MINTTFSNTWSLVLIITLSTAGSIVGGYKFRENSQLIMPNEYKVIRKIVNKLSANNDLGNQPLVFTIVSGSRAYWTAQAMELIKEDGWTFYRHINPFKTYKGKSSNEINEAIRQAYLYNGNEAFAFPNGTIGISHSTFRHHQNKDDYLACIIGHEISHVINHDSFNDSLRLGKEAKGFKKKKKKMLRYRISRETEKSADINSAKMILKAGFPRDTCLKAFEFISRIEGDGGETTKDSTHPGYEERRAELVKFLESYEEDLITKEKVEKKWKWIYSRKLNTLTFIST